MEKIYNRKTSMPPKILVELVLFVFTIHVCAGWRFKVHLWNRAHDDIYLNIHNLRLDSCLNECVLRPWCVAVQYHRIRRSCGILSDQQATTQLQIWKYFIYVKRSTMELTASCDKGRRLDTKGTCITECSVPTNPRIYSVILGVPLLGRRVDITCHRMFTQDGDRIAKCSENGHFDILPTCQIAEDINVALNRPTWLSSKLNAGIDSSAAVDGDRNPVYQKGSCIHTSRGGLARPWWMVDLGDIFNVQSVVVYNRMDCCSFRFRNVYILVLMEKSLDTTLDGELCAYEDGPFPQPVITFTCLRGARGRYLKILLETTQALNVCEVEVFVSTIQTV